MPQRPFEVINAHTPPTSGRKRKTEKIVLTDEQRDKIRKNRERALALRQQVAARKLQTTDHDSYDATGKKRKISKNIGLCMDAEFVGGDGKAREMAVEIERLKQENATLLQEKEHARVSFDSVKSQRDLYIKEAISAESKVSELEDLIKQLQENINSATSPSSTKNNEDDANFRKKYENAQTDFLCIESQYKKALDVNTASNSRIIELEALLTECQNEVDTLKNDLKTMTTECVSHRDEAKKARLEVSTAKDVLAKADDANLRKKYENVQTDFLRIESQYKKALDVNTASNSRITELEALLTECQNKSDVLKNDLKTITLECESHRDEAKKARLEVSKAKDALAKANTDRDKALADLNTIELKLSKITTAQDESPAVVPRITGKLTLKSLQEEAQTRGLEKKSIPKLKKDLLHHLVDGSIYITKTDAWKKVLDYRKRLEMEKGELYESSLRKQRDAERRMEERALAREAKEREKMKREEEERKRRRKEEMDGQLCFHKKDFPFVHCHSLAPTNKLIFYGEPRSDNSECSICQSDRHSVWGQPKACCVWTCEQCDFDICETCFQKENVSIEEKNRRAEELRKQRQLEAEERQRRYEEEERERDEEEREHERKWDASEQFKKAIIKPKDKNKDHDGNKLKGFTVWCSNGYGNDGWHSYEGPPDKYFDTTWMSRKDANDRARYLFFWKNCWGLGPDELEENNEICESVTKQGLVKYSVTPDDSECWTVSVVPDQAYPHLDDACMRRHNHDDERECKVGSARRYGRFMF